MAAAVLIEVGDLDLVVIGRRRWVGLVVAFGGLSASDRRLEAVDGRIARRRPLPLYVREWFCVAHWMIALAMSPRANIKARRLAVPRSREPASATVPES